MWKKNCCVEIIQLLIENNTNPNDKDNRGKSSSIDLASENEN